MRVSRIRHQYQRTCHERQTPMVLLMPCPYQRAHGLAIERGRIVDSRAAIGHVRRYRLFLQAFPGGHTRGGLFGKRGLLSSASALYSVCKTPASNMRLICMLSGAPLERVPCSQSYFFGTCKSYARARVGCQRASWPSTDGRRACRRGRWRGHRVWARRCGMGRAVHGGAVSVADDTRSPRGPWQTCHEA